MFLKNFKKLELIVGWMLAICLVLYFFFSVTTLITSDGVLGYFNTCENIKDNTLKEQCLMSLLFWSGPVGLLHYFDSLWGNYHSVVRNGFIGFYVLISIVYVGLSIGLVYCGLRIYHSLKNRSGYIRWIAILVFIWFLGGSIAGSFLT